jgi:uncharacterized membrane protein
VSVTVVVLWLHLVAAMFWVGGQLFLVLVLLPALRHAVDAGERTRLAAAVGRRFLLTAWLALLILIVSGAANAVLRGVTWATLGGDPYGHVLGVKIVLVGIVLVLTAVHGLYYGGRLEELARQEGHDPRAAARRQAVARRSMAVSSANLLLNLVVVLLAAQLGEMPSPR